MNAWELYETILRDCAISAPLYVYGPPGVGKTFAAYTVGRIERGVDAVTLTEETSAAELRGHFIFRGNDTVWHDGPFVRAMRQGGRLVVNEVSNASADVEALLVPILESAKTARLTLPSGETVSPAEGFHCVLTDNLPPDSLPLRLRDRFLKLHLPEPHPASLAALPETLRRPARAAVMCEDAQRQTGMRAWHAFAALSERFGVTVAAGLAFGTQASGILDSLRTSASVRGDKLA